ncbi:MAG: TrkA family potassium uptake protein [Clostridiaceae bacterium]|nr:TrkA family potassium uptake protein [Clostridiaceae bacterium]
MRTVLIIGLGRFGKHLALRMAELGNEVMVVDTDEAKVEEMLPFVTRAQIGDCMNEKILRSLGVTNFDFCFVAIGDNFQASLEITSQLKELGARYVIAKADRTIHEKFLLRNGADAVIHPERDAAMRAARAYGARNVFDYLELTEDFSVIEVAVPDSWAGKSIGELRVQSKYNVNIIACKIGGKIRPVAGADYVLSKEQHIIIAGNADKCAIIPELP